MKLRHQHMFKKSVVSIFESMETEIGGEKQDELRFLADLVNAFRPPKPHAVEIVSIRPLLVLLEEHPVQREIFKSYLHRLFQKKKFKTILTDAGVLQDATFRQEIRKRIVAKLLPYQPEKDTLEYVLNQVFYLHKDIVWINKIPLEELGELFDVLGWTTINASVKKDSPLLELINAIRLIMQRMSGRALESEVIKMVPEYENLESPFEALEKEFEQVEQKIRGEGTHSVDPEDIDYKQMSILLKQCSEFVDKAYGNSHKYGISIRVTQSLLRIKQQLYRLSVLLPLLTARNEAEAKKNTIQLAVKLVKYNCRKNNVRKLFNESTQLIAYEITQHTAKTGEHYITKSSTEYWKMLYSAMGGGVIVGVLCILKLLLSKAHVSDFGHAFLYSMNYALGFIAIFLLGFTLATKQPAMTAAALIQSIEKDKHEKEEVKYRSFAELFARLFRSQFIAFVGNVVFAFPVSLLGIYLIDLAFDHNIAEGKWEKLLTDISPVHSAAIFHAAIAGVFLFLAGIISGSVSNSNKHNHLYYRIQEHPILKLSLGKLQTTRIARWFEEKWAGVASNLWFGFFMGSTASIGIFLGLNLDIRHITFVSGNLALGLYGGHFDISGTLLFWAIFGIGIIGFVNFIVSFLLSLTLAFRSRNIPISDLKFLFIAVWVHFKLNPWEFFFPVRGNQ